jgi:hypothetical protein
MNAPAQVEHHVTLSITTSADHASVQSRVLAAVVREFSDDERGPVSVVGFNRAKLEKDLARAYEERDAYREAWLNPDHALARDRAANKTIRIRLVNQRDGLALVDKIGPKGKDACELLTLLPSEAEDLRLALEAARTAKPGAYVCASGGRVDVDESTCGRRRAP